MASTTNNLTLILGVADAQLQAGIKRAQRAIRGLGRETEITEKRTSRSMTKIAAKTRVSMASSRKSVARFSEAVRTSVVNLRYLATFFAGGALMVGVVKFSSKFETSMANVNTLLDESGVKIDRYKQQLLELSTRSSKDLLDLSKALYQIVSAGIPAIEGLGGAYEFLERAQAGAVAGLAETEEAANAMLSFVQAYKTQGLSAARAADILQKTVEKGRTTWSQLAHAIGRVTPLAAKFGMRAEEVGASLVVLTRAGVNTNEAVTGMRAVINNIAKPTKKAKDTLKALGIEFDSATIRTHGFAGVLKELYDKTGGNIEIMGRLFPNIRALLPVVVQAGQDFHLFNEALLQMEESSGAVDTAVKKIEGTFTHTAAILKSNFQRVLIQIGSGKGGVLAKVGEAVESLSDKLAYGADGATGAIQSLLTGLVDVITFIAGPLKDGIEILITLFKVRIVLAIGLAIKQLQLYIATMGAASGVAAAGMLTGTGGSAAMGALAASAMIGRQGHTLPAAPVIPGAVSEGGRWAAPAIGGMAAGMTLSQRGASAAARSSVGRFWQGLVVAGSGRQATKHAMALGGATAENMATGTSMALGQAGMAGKVMFGLRGLMMGAMRMLPWLLIISMIAGPLIRGIKKIFSDGTEPVTEAARKMFEDMAKGLKESSTKIRDAMNIWGGEPGDELKTALRKLEDFEKEFYSKRGTLGEKALREYRRRLKEKVRDAKQAFRDVAKYSVEGALEQQKQVEEGRRVRLKPVQKGELEQTLPLGDTTHTITELIEAETAAIQQNELAKGRGITILDAQKRAIASVTSALDHESGALVKMQGNLFSLGSSVERLGVLGAAMHRHLAHPAKLMDKMTEFWSKPAWNLESGAIPVPGPKSGPGQIIPMHEFLGGRSDPSGLFQEPLGRKTMMRGEIEEQAVRSAASGAALSMAAELEVEIREGIVKGLVKGGEKAGEVVKSMNEYFQGLEVIPGNTEKRFSDLSRFVVKYNGRQMSVAKFMKANSDYLSAADRSRIAYSLRRLQLRTQNIAMGRTQVKVADVLSREQIDSLVKLRGFEGDITAEKTKQLQKTVDTIVAMGLLGEKSRYVFRAHIRQVDGAKAIIAATIRKAELDEEAAKLRGKGDSKKRKIESAINRIIEMRRKAIQNIAEMEAKLALDKAKRHQAESDREADQAQRRGAALRDLAKIQGKFAKQNAFTNIDSYDEEMAALVEVDRTRRELADAEIKDVTQKEKSKRANERAKFKQQQKFAKKTKKGRREIALADKAFNDREAQGQRNLAEKIISIRRDLVIDLFKTEERMLDIQKSKMKVVEEHERAASAHLKKEYERRLAATRRYATRVKAALEDALLPIREQSDIGAISEQAAKRWFEAWRANAMRLKAVYTDHQDHAVNLTSQMLHQSKKALGTVEADPFAPAITAAQASGTARRRPKEWSDIIEKKRPPYAAGSEKDKLVDEMWAMRTERKRSRSESYATDQANPIKRLGSLKKIRLELLAIAKKGATAQGLSGAEFLSTSTRRISLLTKERDLLQRKLAIGKQLGGWQSDDKKALELQIERTQWRIQQTQKAIKERDKLNRAITKTGVKGEDVQRKMALLGTPKVVAAVKAFQDLTKGIDGASVALSDLAKRDPGLSAFINLAKKAGLESELLLEATGLLDSKLRKTGLDTGIGSGVDQISTGVEGAVMMFGKLLNVVGQTALMVGTVGGGIGLSGLAKDEGPIKEDDQWIVRRAKSLAKSASEAAQLFSMGIEYGFDSFVDHVKSGPLHDVLNDISKTAGFDFDAEGTFLDKITGAVGLLAGTVSTVLTLGIAKGPRKLLLKSAKAMGALIVRPFTKFGPHQMALMKAISARMLADAIGAAQAFGDTVATGMAGAVSGNFAPAMDKIFKGAKGWGDRIADSVSVVFASFFKGNKLLSDTMRKTLGPILKVPGEILQQVNKVLIAPAMSAIAGSFTRLFSGISEAFASLTDPAKLDSAFRERYADIRKESGAIIATLRAQAKTTKDIGEYQKIQEQIADEEKKRNKALAEARKEQEEGRPENVLQKAIDQALEMIDKVVAQLPALMAMAIQALIDNLPTLIEKAIEALASVAEVLATKLPELMLVVIQQLVESLPRLIDALVTMIPAVFDALLVGITELLYNIGPILGELLRGLLQATGGILRSIIRNIPTLIAALVAAIPELITAVVEAIPILVEEVVSLIPEIFVAIIAAVPAIIAALIKSIPRLVVALIISIPRIIVALVKGVGKGMQNVVEGAFNPITRAWEHLTSAWYALGDWLAEIGKTFKGDSAGSRAARIGAYTAGGAAVGSLVPIPGATLVGAGVGAAVGGVIELGDYLGWWHKGGVIPATRGGAGIAAMLGAAGAPAFAYGGMVNRNIGDAMRRQMMGIPSALRDDIPAVLQAGESVLNRRATASIGASGVGALNSGEQLGGPTNISISLNAAGSGVDRAAAALLPFLIKGVTVEAQRPGSGLRTEITKSGRSMPIGSRGTPSPKKSGSYGS